MSSPAPSTSLAAWSFVLIWSTGFISARAIAGRVDPNLFLTLRFAIAAALFTGFIAWRRASVRRRREREGTRTDRLEEGLAPASPRTFARSVPALLLVGALVQGLYLGPGFWAVAHGLQPGIMSLLASMQPLLTACLGAALALPGERVTPRTWLGLALGVAGVSCAVVPALDGPSSVSPAVVLAAVGSVAAITVGTLLQRLPSVRATAVLEASAVQCVGGCLVTAALAALLGETHVTVDVVSVGALLWAILVLSIGGFTLLMWLVRHDGATRASALLLIVPPLAALQAWSIFGDALSALQIAGFVLALGGVALARSS